MSKASSVWHGIRFAAIGSLSKGLAMVNREWGRQYLVREISRMPGLPVKVAQLLEMKYGMPGWQQHSGMAQPLEWVKERILAEAPRLGEEILEISEEGVTASLGQVHWAKLKSGKEVAIKVQYPGVGNQLEEQLDVLLGAMEFVPASRKFGLDVEAYSNFLREFFLREANYQVEADSQARFRAAWGPLGGVVVPEVFPDWSSERLLVQSFEASTWLDSLKTEPEETRRSAAEALARVALVGALRLGHIHTDLHPRNWGFRPQSKQLVLYDFGATLRLDAGTRQALQGLFFSADDSPTGCLSRFGQLGFDVSQLSHISHHLPELLELIAEPFHHEGPWDPRAWRVSERMEDLLGAERWWFRVSGPPWFLLLMRALYGAVKAAESLQAGVDIQKILSEGVGLQVPPSRHHAVHASVGGSAARALKVHVMEGEELIVDLELPARAVEDLEHVIPAHVAEKLGEKGIDILRIKKECLDSGLAPRELFHATHGKRSYKVWLK